MTKDQAILIREVLRRVRAPVLSPQEVPAFLGAFQALTVICDAPSVSEQVDTPVNFVRVAETAK